MYFVMDSRKAHEKGMLEAAFFSVENAARIIPKLRMEYGPVQSSSGKFSSYMA
jgi:hypothetical protein